MTASDPVTRTLAALLERTTGQQIAPDRHWRIDAALAPLMRERGLDSPASLVARIIDGSDDGLRDAVVDLLLNHETFFFRDAALFRTLDGVALDDLRARRSATRRLSVWCAGCSTGQEVHSLAMSVAGAGERWAGWTIDLLGTDVAAAAVRRAEAGVYSSFEIQRGLPVTQMIRWFDPRGDDWAVKPEIARRSRFAVHNLLDPVAPPGGPFDVILCRNLLIYLPDNRRRAAFDRLREASAPDGYLMLGAGETVGGQTDRFRADADARGLFRPATQSTRRAA